MLKAQLINLSFGYFLLSAPRLGVGRGVDILQQALITSIDKKCSTQEQQEQYGTRSDMPNERKTLTCSGQKGPLFI